MNGRRRTPSEAVALLGVAWRGVTWTIPNVRRELNRWRERALLIPDPALRTDALETLRREHMNAHGAALFAVLPRKRNRALLRLLVAYQVALDYLDTVTERPAPDELAYGNRLHRSLVDALDPGAGPTDYYGERPWEDDGGYLRALVEACQRGCASLPGYPAVRSYALTAASNLSVQVLNHLTDAADRDAALRAWSDDDGRRYSELRWFERSGAASSTLGIYALLAAAARRLRAEEARAIDAAYHPTVCLLCTLMDSLADYDEDRASGAHSYVAHYGSAAVATERIADLIPEALADVRRLPSGSRHVVIVSGMVAMYLAAQGSPAGSRLGSDSRRIRARAGWLATAAFPVTRIMDRTHDRSICRHRLPQNTE